MGQKYFFTLLGLLASATAVAGDKPACTYVEVAKIPLHYSGPDLEITLDGEIDGTPAPMLVDTGAFESFMTRTGAERRNLTLLYTREYVDGVGGESGVMTTLVREFAVGPARAGKTAWMKVLSKTGFVPSFDAIVGAPFLMQADLEISLAEKQLKFFRPSGCKDAFLGYWPSGAIDVPFLSGSRADMIPRVAVKVNGHELKAIIDSGSGSSWIRLDAARRVGLKLDAPGVSRASDTTGIGERKVAQWNAVLDSFSIGAETISKPELGILDTHGEIDDVVLGADFLRAHHVLFAMSQRKLYLSYVGGKVFSQSSDIEPWIRQEAEGGNADAQYVLATSYSAGDTAAQDQGQAWLDKAASNGSPYANLALGRQMLRAGRYAEAVERLKPALDKLPAERFGALLLYLARLRGGGDPATARSELEATFARSEGAWPAPIGDFYLGRIDAGKLLSIAGKDRDLSRSRTCDAHTWLAEWHEAHAQQDQAAAWKDSAQTSCAPAAGKPRT
jgi:predicted aspartyl protease